jgi:hypothetical protein
MKFEEIKTRLEKYETRQAELIQLQAVAKSDRERYDIERMRRIVQTIEWGLVSRLKECVSHENPRSTPARTARKEVRA